MPRNKSGGLLKALRGLVSTTAGKVGLGIATVALVGGGALAYGKGTGNDVVLKFGGRGYGVHFDPDTGQPSAQTGPYGCCLDFCSDMYEIECSPEHGYDGTFVAKACNQLEECEKGCCQVGCKVEENFPHVACTKMGGDWSKGACVIGCCSHEGGSSELPEKTCTECAHGREWKPGKCPPGYEVHLKGSETQKSTTERMLPGMEGTAKELFAIFGQEYPEIDVTMTVDIDGYSCGESVFSKWHFDQKVDVSPCSKGDCSSKTSFWLDFSTGPEFDISGYAGAWSGSAMKYTMGQGTFSVYFDPILSQGPMEFSANVSKGSDQCKKGLWPF